MDVVGGRWLNRKNSIHEICVWRFGVCFAFSFVTVRSGGGGETPG